MDCFSCRHRGKVIKDGCEISAWYCRERADVVFNNKFTTRAHCWYFKR